jgi:hypothetical protein
MAESNAKNDYEQDFYGWTMQQAELLRQRRYSEVDIANIAEELETLGRSERREMTNRLAVLLMHLLKWQYQPVLRSRSWRLTIKEQRQQLRILMDENPSLQAQYPQILQNAWDNALIKAAAETGLDETGFPQALPWPLQQILDQDFWPPPDDYP